MGRLTIENRTGYDTEDLHRFFVRGLGAVRLKAKSLHIIVSAAPRRSRGCAEIRGSVMSIALGPPSQFSLRRLARLLEHEAAHIAGMDHDEMPHKLLYSLGPTPSWARGFRIRYRGRAPDQLKALRHSHNSRR